MFQSIIKHFGYPTVDLFASRLCHHLPQYAAWKPDPNSIVTDPMQQCWNKIFPYAFPFQSDKSNSEKGASRKGRVNDNTYTNMANTTLVYTSVRDVNTVPTAVGTIARSTVRSSRKQIPFSSKQETNISGLKSYRKSLEMEGILSNAVKLISQSKRPGSIISYKSGWSKWTGWCVREKIEQFCAHLSKIVNYLSTLFDEDLQYRAENAHR